MMDLSIQLFKVLVDNETFPSCLFDGATDRQDLVMQELNGIVDVIEQPTQDFLYCAPYAFA